MSTTTTPKTKRRKVTTPTTAPPIPTSEIVMERADPPDPRRGPSPEHMFELFAEAHKKYPYEWVLIAKYRSSHGYRIKRAIERGEIQVPGGAGKWEVKASGAPNPDNYGRVETELYARRLKLRG